jgi:hypothetical protein
MRQHSVVTHDISTVWNRIQSRAGETFTLKRGEQFTYHISASCLVPDRTNRQLPKGDFAKALDLVPLTGPGQILYLQGPSYVYAVLMDDRIRSGYW